MTLVRDKATVLQYAQFGFDGGLDTLNPLVQEVELEYLVYYLGRAQYDQLNVPDFSTLNPEEQELLSYAQRASTLLSIASYTPRNQARVGSGGVMRAGDKDAFAYQAAKVQASHEAGGLKAIDTMLAYLEDNAATFPLWANSEAYTRDKTLLVNKAATFDKHYNIGASAMAYREMQANLRKAQYQVGKAITQELLEEVLATIATGSVDSDTAKLLDYLQPAVVYLALSDLYRAPTNKMANQAFYKLETTDQDTNTKRTQSTLQERSTSAKQHEADGQMRLSDCVDYLNKNASPTRYITWYNSDKYRDPAAAEPELDTSKKVVAL